MPRILVLLALAIVTVSSAPVLTGSIDFDTLPSQYKELIPPELLEYVKSITPEEHQIGMEHMRLAKNYETDEEFFAELKKKSPSLYEKAEKFGQFLQSKYEKLHPSVQTLFKKIEAKRNDIREQYLSGKVSIKDLRKTFKEFYTEYMALSDEAKATIVTEFPFVVKLSQNPMIQAIVAQLLQE